MKNLIKTILFIFTVQLCFSQQKTEIKYPSVMVVNKDTLVCFTKEQSKQVTVWNEQRKECLELRKNDNQKINELEKINTEQIGLISNLENENNLMKLSSIDKDELIKIRDDENKSLKKEVRKQKIGKWTAIIGGVVLSTILLIK